MDIKVHYAGTLEEAINKAKNSEILYKTASGKEVKIQGTETSAILYADKVTSERYGQFNPKDISTSGVNEIVINETYINSIDIMKQSQAEKTVAHETGHFLGRIDPPSKDKKDKDAIKAHPNNNEYGITSNDARKIRMTLQDIKAFYQNIRMGRIGVKVDIKETEQKNDNK